MAAVAIAMSIPVQADSDLAEISNSADLVLLKCRVLRHAARGDVPRLRAELKTHLRQMVDLALKFADDCDVQ
jgi:hypothetical protein